MIEDIFAVRVEKNLNKEEDQIVTTNTQHRGDNKGRRDLVANHVYPDIDTHHHNIEYQHAWPHLKWHETLALQSQFIPEVSCVNQKDAKNTCAYHHSYEWKFVKKFTLLSGLIDFRVAFDLTLTKSNI